MPPWPYGPTSRREAAEASPCGREWSAWPTASLLLLATGSFSVQPVASCSSLVDAARSGRTAVAFASGSSELAAAAVVLSAEHRREVPILVRHLAETGEGNPLTSAEVPSLAEVPRDRGTALNSPALEGVAECRSRASSIGPRY